MDAPESKQRIIPYLGYADAPAAIEFLRDAFGFEERYRMAADGGLIGHAELTYGDNVLMLASVWTAAGFASPLDLAGIHTQLVCEVEDADAHCARARAAGATIIGEPADTPHGGRSYRALDPEGHRWIFSGPASQPE
jgi:uncharacterized glyoxalase superfamily protein PhnB